MSSQAPYMQYSAVHTTMEFMVVQAFPSSLLSENSVYQVACRTVPPVQSSGHDHAVRQNMDLNSALQHRVLCCTCLVSVKHICFVKVVWCMLDVQVSEQLLRCLPPCTRRHMGLLSVSALWPQPQSVQHV